MQQYSLLERFHGAFLGQAIAATHFALPTTRQLGLQNCSQWLLKPTQSAPPTLTGNRLNDCLTLLPLWLYTHESWRQRQAYLAQIPDWHQAHIDRASLWLYGETIAQVIRPTCHLPALRLNLLQRWKTHVQQGAPACPDRWQTELESDLPTTQTATSAETLLSFCLWTFLNTPQDITIALHRIDQLNHPHNATIATVTAALIGTYQGWSHFPTDQVFKLLQSDLCAATSIRESDELPSADSILPYASMSRQLLTTWSGMTLSPTNSAMSQTMQVLTPR